MARVDVCAGCGLETVVWGAVGYCVATKCQNVEGELAMADFARRRPRDERGKFLPAKEAA